jgi:hypothetical protein
MSRKKIGKYLLYALGEIVLVVIGILIALAINNANQRQILRDKEQVYLAGLQREFSTSHRKLKELIRVNEANIEGARTLAEYCSNEAPYPEEVVLSNLLFSTFAYDISYNPNVSLLTEMINSGSLKDLRNDTLRIRLTNWISTLEDIEKQENELRIYRENAVEMLRSNDFSIRTIMDHTGVSKNELRLVPKKKPVSNLALLKSLDFENNLLLFMLTSSGTGVTHYEPLLADLEEILSLIEQEMEY